MELTGTEQWLQEALKADGQADLAHRADRRVRGDALRVVLEAVATQVKHRIFRLTGVELMDPPFDMSHTSLDYSLELHRCSIKTRLIFDFATMLGLSLRHCSVMHEISLYSVRMAGHLVISGPAGIPGLSCEGARVGGDCRILAPIIGTLDLSNTRFDGDLLLEGEWGSAISAGPDFLAINLYRSRIEGGLQVTGVARGSMMLAQASVAGPVLLHECHAVAEQGFASNVVGDGLRAGTLSVKKSNIEGWLRLPGATIGGQTELDEVRIRGMANYALDFNGARLDGGLKLGPHLLCGASVRLDDAVLGAELQAGGIAVEASAGLPAVYASRLAVNGNVLLQSAVLRGQLCFVAARLSADLDLTAAQIDATPVAIDLTRCRVEGDVHLVGNADTPAYVGGAIDAARTVVGGSFVVASAHLGAGRLPASGENTSLAIHSAEMLHVLLQADVIAEGAMHIADSRIRGYTDLSGLDARSHPGPAVLLLNSETDALIFGAMKVLNPIGISGMQARTVVDLMTIPRGSIINRLSYETMGDADGEAKDVQSRLEWLAQLPFRPSNYEALADFYARQGAETARRKTLDGYFARERQVERSASRRLELEVSRWFGNGYRPTRALRPLALLYLTLAISLSSPNALNALEARGGGDRLSASTGACPTNGECYNAWYYAADTVVPLLNLGQRNSWRINTDAWQGAAFQFISNLWRVAGFACTSVAVLAFGRFARRVRP